MFNTTFYISKKSVSSKKNRFLRQINRFSSYRYGFRRTARMLFDRPSTKSTVTIAMTKLSSSSLKFSPVPRFAHRYRKPTLNTRQGQAVHRQTFDTEFSQGDWSDVKSDSKSVFSAKNPVGLCPVKISFNFPSEDRSSIRKLKRDSTFYRTQSSLFDFLSNNFVGRVAVDENVSREVSVDH